MSSQSSLPQPEPRDHARLAHEYALGVLDHSIPAGMWVRKAAQRQLDDLERADKNDPEFPYWFDAEAGARVCRFIELFPHVKGAWASERQKLVLQPWQCFLVMALFGWRQRKNGFRRFRIAYWETPRKSGKSFLAAAIGLYMFLADKEMGAEIYSGASTEKQAWEVFKPAKLMLQKSPRALRAFGAEVWAKVLVNNKTYSKFEPLIGNPGDGSSPSCAIVDEYHEHNTSAFYDAMETGMGARQQPLLLVITTAGYNLASPCYDKHEEVCRVLNKLVPDERLFGCIFSIDDKDDWTDPKSLIKANPNYGVSVDADFLLAQQRAAKVNPVQQNAFKTKHLNIWCSVLAAWMNLQLWKLATDILLEEEELIDDKKVKRWIAIDLASKSDLCCEMRLYQKMIDGKPNYYLFGRYWLPEDTIEEPGLNHAMYKAWVKKGLLTPTEGATIDFDQITEEVLADAKRINPLEIVYDPFNATQMAQNLMAGGFKKCVEFIQLPHNFALPMDEIMSALKDNRFHHDGNAITTWCMSNVVARPAKKGLFSPIKAKEHQKIDGAIAAAMAMARAVATKEPERQYQMITLGAPKK